MRRGEVLALTVDAIQLREEHWVIADLHGKAGHIRTVPIPLWVKQVIDLWTEASGIKGGCLFRAINKSGQIWGDGMTPKVLWEIVKKAAEAAGIEKLAPHDLRRTCARLYHLAGGELDQTSSCSVTCPSRLPSITLAVSRSSEAPLTTSSESNRDGKERITRPLPTRADHGQANGCKVMRQSRSSNTT